MSSDPERDDPKQDLKQGLSLLWRAARKTAVDLRKDLDRTSVGKVIDDAGRELVRAASNVVGRIGAELSKGPSPAPREEGRDDDAGPDAPARPPAGPTPEDPGFRIAVDPDDDKGEKPR
ncbi:hypothetical protein SOCE26_096120 [Sorangium cellulosum]|uniref:Uncharacterized protein n=1 Tax=Sorangium cellulosum TaxID=56 RepID=A0A2L0F933_SORCE|nr:hypothetical protein [Sorangium cellulosum]AUX48084.1 hypothetical protein SOCE26_096120 [Sorangium cellulosum]